MAGPLYNIDHALETGPAIEADVCAARRVSLVAHGAREEGVSCDGLYTYDKSATCLMALCDTEALAQREALWTRVGFRLGDR